MRCIETDKKNKREREKKRGMLSRLLKAR